MWTSTSPIGREIFPAFCLPIPRCSHPEDPWIWEKIRLVCCVACLETGWKWYHILNNGGPMWNFNMLNSNMYSQMIRTPLPWWKMLDQSCLTQKPLLRSMKSLTYAWNILLIFSIRLPPHLRKKPEILSYLEFGYSLDMLQVFLLRNVWKTHWCYCHVRMLQVVYDHWSMIPCASTPSLIGDVCWHWWSIGHGWPNQWWTAPHRC